MRKIRIADVTLREAASQNGWSLSFKEKIELAKSLDRLGVDIIETAPLTGEKSDALLILTISSLVKDSVVCCPAGLDAESVEAAWQAVSGAKRPRLLVSLPVSPVTMEYGCRMKPAKVLEAITTLVSAAREKCADVEFAAVDATRAEPGFLTSALNAALAAGAGSVTVCDSAGMLLPDEFSDFITNLYERVPELKNAALCVQCGDELGVAGACALASVKAGASCIKTVVGGGAYPTLEAAAHILRSRGDSLGISTGLDMTALRHALGRMKWLVNTERSALSPFENSVGEGVFEDDTVLDENSDISAVSAALTRRGYELSGDDLARVYESFLRIAVKKRVSAVELDAIVANTALQVPPTYKIVSYVVNLGNIITATANIVLEKDGQTLRGLSVGDGPVDASFLAIEQILGHHYELDDFQISAITEGREAMGCTLVKLRSGGRLYSGQGVSTDVIGASIRAYVDALNKIAYEERKQ